MKKRHAKSYGREKAIKSRYQQLMNKNEITIDDIEGQDPLALKIVNEINENQEEIDKLISKYLKKWSLKELNPVNRAIMEVAVWEFLNDTTPRGIVISEALMFADTYTDLPSRRFIHFVLDNINKNL